MTEAEHWSPMTHLARWRGVLILWAVTQFAALMFGTPIRFQVGLFGPLFNSAWLLGGLALLMFSVISALRQRAWGAAVVPVVIAFLLTASLLASASLDRLGDSIVFETRAPRYEAAIARLEAGEPKERACAEFRHGCGVSRNGALRVAFFHPEFHDKYLGYVYDPSGVYGRLLNLASEEREALRGELVPGAPLYCRPLRAHFYRCFFS